MEINIKGLALFENGNTKCPVLICQLCKKPIRKKELFGVYYNFIHKSKVGIIAHKECENKANLQKDYPSWQEGEEFIKNLIWNIKH